MSMGVPYDSDQGRDYAGAITADHVRPGVPDQRAHRRGGRAVRRATRANEQPFLEVIRMHRDAVNRIDSRARAGGAVCRARGSAGTRPTKAARRAGFRNAQVTVIAPTGTIGFMMDCDTTGIEPDLALVKYKKLVGGGVIKIVNNTVPQALIKLGYSPEQVEKIVSHIDSTGTIEGAPASEAGAPAGVRLQLPAAERRALHPLHGPRADDGGGAAVHLRRDLEDHQHAGGVARWRTSWTPTSRAGGWG